ncbi:hypothetical protein M9458_053707, partial [Cirrhinus mrigala]
MRRLSGTGPATRPQRQYSPLQQLREPGNIRMLNSQPTCTTAANRTPDINWGTADSHPTTEQNSQNAQKRPDNQTQEPLPT